MNLLKCDIRYDADRDGMECGSERTKQGLLLSPNTDGGTRIAHCSERPEDMVLSVYGPRSTSVLLATFPIINIAG